MSLFLIHCGFYQPSIFDGLYENHVNFFIIAHSFEDARKKVRSNSEFKKHNMHIDGLQEIKVIDGFKISVENDEAFPNKTIINTFNYRALKPKLDHEQA